MKTNIDSTRQMRLNNGVEMPVLGLGVYLSPPAQVILRWHFQNGVAAIPKSVNPDRIASNFDIFDFELTPENMAAIDALDTGLRSGPDPDLFDMAFLKAMLEQQAGKEGGQS